MHARPHKSTLRAIASRFRVYLQPRLAKLGFPPDLTGACAISSIALADYLVKLNFDAILVVGVWDPPPVYNGTDTDHCWVEVGRKWIIDLTITQFGRGKRYPEVLIVPRTDKRYRSVYRGEFAVWHVASAWPSEQVKPVRSIELPAELPRRILRRNSA